jgi:hypothetical protein
MAALGVTGAIRSARTPSLANRPRHIDLEDGRVIRPGIRGCS